MNIAARREHGIHQETADALNARERDLLPVFAIGGFACIHDAEITGINTVIESFT